MHTLSDMPQELGELDTELKSNLEHFILSAKIKCEAVLLPSTTNFKELLNSKEYLYRIVEGSLCCWWGTQILYFLNEGDLFGFEHLYLQSNLTFSSEFALRVERFSWTSVLTACKDTSHLEQFNGVIARSTLRLTALLAAAMEKEVILAPSIKTFDAGDTIIHQGATATEVYSLVQGEAEVFVDGVPVGAIKCDEIFGMLAVLTKTTRTATVRAKSNCTVLSVEQNKFIEFIKSKPSAVLSMVENMASHIVALNQRVVKASSTENFHEL